jgi:predicted nuclease with TOPRIM domain
MMTDARLEELERLGVGLVELCTEVRRLRSELAKVEETAEARKKAVQQLSESIEKLTNRD